MLHVAFAELMRGGAEQLFAQQFAARAWTSAIASCKLIAKTKSAAGLIKPVRAHKPAGNGLIQQPAIGQNIHGGFGRFHMDGAQRVFPDNPRLFAVLRGTRRRF